MRTFSAVVAATLGLIVLITLFIFIRSMKDGSQDFVDKQICKKSVEENVLFRFDKLTMNTDIKCPTKFIKSTATNKNAVFETLALAMADTWDEFLRGTNEVFDTSTQNYCVVRRVIEFNTPEKYEGFFAYLIMHNPPGVKMPYFSYLTNIDVNQGKIVSLTNPDLKSNDVIDTSTPYAAVFILAKKDRWSKLESTGAGIGTGAAAGTAAGLFGGYILLTIVQPELGIPVVLVKLAASTLLASSVVGGTYAGGIVGYALGSQTPADWQSGMYLVPYTEENLKSMDCSKLPVAITENGASGE